MAHLDSIASPIRVPRGLGRLAALATFLFWILGVMVPLGAIFRRAPLTSTGFFSPEILGVVQSTLFQASISTLISGALGLALGTWIGSRLGRWSRWAEVWLAVPFGIPSVVAALSWILWLGRSGLLARWGLPLDFSYSLKAVILAHVFFNAPWVALLVAQARRSLPIRKLEAAATLGAGRGARFRWVIWPHVKWAFFSALAQSFGFCAMSFALVLILGGGPPVQTLETALYDRIHYGTLDISGAVVCALWELLLTLTPWFLVLLLRAREKQSSSPVRVGAEEKAGPLFSGIGLWGGAAFFVAPYFLIFSMKEGSWLETIARIQSEVLPAWVVSLKIALGVSLGAVGMGAVAVMALAYLGSSNGGKRLEAWSSALVLMPSGISTLVLGLGLWLAYGKWLDPFAGGWTGLAAIIGVQMVIFFPSVFRILWPPAQQMPLRQFEAAATLGCGPVKAFFLLDWPRWRGPVLSATAMVFAAALGEVAAVSFFYNENLIPMPLLLSRWMSQYRFEDAQVLSALLFFFSIFAVTLVLRSADRAEPRHS